MTLAAQPLVSARQVSLRSFQHSPSHHAQRQGQQLPHAQTAGCCAAQGEKYILIISSQETPKKKLGS